MAENEAYFDAEITRVTKDDGVKMEYRAEELKGDPSFTLYFKATSGMFKIGEKLVVTVKGK